MKTAVGSVRGRTDPVVSSRVPSASTEYRLNGMTDTSHWRRADHSGAAALTPAVHQPVPPHLPLSLSCGVPYAGSHDVARKAPIPPLTADANRFPHPSPPLSDAPHPTGTSSVPVSRRFRASHLPAFPCPSDCSCRRSRPSARTRHHSRTGLTAAAHGRRRDRVRHDEARRRGRERQRQDDPAAHPHRPPRPGCRIRRARRHARDRGSGPAGGRRHHRGRSDRRGAWGGLCTCRV